MTIYDSQEDARRTARLRSALLPVPDRSQRKTKACRKLRLAKAELAAQGAHIGCRPPVDFD